MRECSFAVVIAALAACGGEDEARTVSYALTFAPGASGQFDAELPQSFFRLE